MATKMFDCSECGAHGKIVFRENREFQTEDVVYCPFCGADISGDSEEDEEDSDD